MKRQHRKPIRPAFRGPDLRNVERGKRTLAVIIAESEQRDREKQEEGKDEENQNEQKRLQRRLRIP
jgi:hypothetical protein